MKRCTALSLALGLAIGAYVLPTQAHAATTLTATLNSDPLGETVHVDLNNPGGAGINQNVYAGEYDWTRSSTSNSNNNYSGPPNLGQSFISFCVDLTQTMQLNHSYTYDVVNLSQAPSPDVGGNNPEGPGGMGTTKADDIEELWGRFYSNSFTAHQAAAFQIAIWQIEYGVNLTINSGSGDLSFSGDTTDENQAQTWLNAIDGNTAYYAPLDGITCDSAQDQVILVPTPKAVWMALGLVLAMMGWMGYSRRRQAMTPAWASV